MAPPSLARLLEWHPQPVPVFPIACALAAVVYLAGVVRLARRSDRWPLGRTLAWLLGLACVTAVTGTGVGGYGMEMFSVHMVQHMVLGMLAPILLLLGAPVTLALRALPAGGRFGVVRRTLVRVLHSRAASVACHPAVTLPLFLASLYGLYFTPLFDLAMGSWWGHTWMTAHFVVTGLLFFWPILGVDPAPRRPHAVLRILELFAGMPFHAFFGVSIMMSSGLAVHAFAHPPMAWGISPLSDEHTAGAIAWAFGEVPTILVLLALFVQWSRSDEREARRRDRAAARDGDAELAAYNAYLARLEAAGRRPWET